jgi:hypothetical protein
LNTDQIAGFTSSIKLSLKGLSAEDADKKIQEALGAAGNALAAQVLGDGSFARAGEEAGATLQRLGGSLLTVNAVFNTLGQSALDATLSSGALASELINAFGGLNQLASATSTYYEAFYSEQERTETATRQLTETLGRLGIALPNTGAADALAQYRALVDAQDINTEAGRNTYAALVTLGGGFAQIVSSTQALNGVVVEAAPNLSKMAESLAKALQSLGNTNFDLENDLLSAQGNVDAVRARISARDLAALTEGLDAESAAKVASAYSANEALSVQIKAQEAANAQTERAAFAADALSAATATATDNAFAALERAVDAQRKLINTQLTASQSLAAEVGSIFDALKSAVDDLYRSVDSTAQQSAAQARAFITQSLSGALATGSLPDSKALADAISAARGGIDAQQFTSQFEADRARLVLAGELSQLKDIAGDQLSEAERQIRVLEDQLEALDKTLQTAREQIDVLRGIDATLLTIAQALAGVSKAAGTEAIVRAGQGSIGDKFGAYNALGASGMSDGDIRKEAEAIFGKQTQTDWEFLKQGANQVKQFIEYLPSLAEQTAADKARAYQSLSKTGLNDQDIRKVVEQQLGVQSQSDWEYLGRLAGVPGLAVGTNYVPRDMTARIHEGEMIVPKAFNPATSGMGGGNSDELVAELRELRKEFAEFKALQRAGNENTKQLADQFDQVSAGGNALATEVMT